MLQKIEIGKIYKFAILTYEEAYRDDPLDQNVKYISGNIELREILYDMGSLKLTDKWGTYHDIATAETTLLVIDIYTRTVTASSLVMAKSKSEEQSSSVICLYKNRYCIFQCEFFKKVMEEVI